MIPLSALWLPILLSAVIVFFASFIMHMVLSYHKSDYRKLPDEDRVTDAMRSAGVTRGPAYFFPYCSFKEMKSPPMIEKMKRGPVGLLNVLPSGPACDGKEYDPMVFVLCGDQHLCRLSFRPNAGARNHILASTARCWNRRFARIRRSPRPGIDLERPKLGGHVQASFR
jgi:hypothetical protein